MDKQLGKVLGLSFPDTFDYQKLERYFGDLEKAVTSAVKQTYYEDKDNSLIAEINQIANELDWVQDLFYIAIAYINKAEAEIGGWEQELSSRLTDDEKCELNTLRVQKIIEEASK